MRNIIILGMALVLSACGPFRASKASNPIQKREKIILTNIVLKRLNLVSLTSSQTDSGRLKVVLEMQNEKKKDLWTDVQVAFYDNDKVEVERSSWESFNWEGRAVKTYSKSALNEKASDYRVFIRKIK